MFFIILSRVTDSGEIHRLRKITQLSVRLLIGYNKPRPRMKIIKKKLYT